MSSTNDNQIMDAVPEPGAGGGEDLSDALAGGETEFVASDESKQPGSQQFLILALLLAVAGGGMWFMYKRQGPATARAASTPEAAKAAETIKTFLNNGPGGIKAMQDMLKDTEKVVKQFLEYPSVTQVPLSDLHTNPFRLHLKGDDAAADADAEKKKKEVEKAEVMKASTALQLQSIVHSGSRKACMINNTLYAEGQQVDQFTIEKIEASRVIVKSGAYRFELKMQR
jgi:hypothetical protein